MEAQRKGTLITGGGLLRLTCFAAIILALTASVYARAEGPPLLPSKPHPPTTAPSPEARQPRAVSGASTPVGYCRKRGETQVDGEPRVKYECFRDGDIKQTAYCRPSQGQSVTDLPDLIRRAIYQGTDEGALSGESGGAPVSLSCAGVGAPSSAGLRVPKPESDFAPARAPASSGY